MAGISTYLVLLAVIALGLATVVGISQPFGNRAVRLGEYVSWLGAGLLALAMVVYGVSAGRLPMGSMYEYSVALGFGITAASVVAERRNLGANVGRFVLPVAIAILIYALSLPSVARPLAPDLQNNLLLAAHVSFAIAASSAFAVAFVAAVLYTVQGDGKAVSWLPPAALLDEAAYRAAVLGVPLFAVTMFLGAIWAENVWGRYWSWDPKEVASLITLLIYVAYLHSRSLRGWRGAPGAFLLMAGFVTLLFTFVGVNLFFGGMHRYGGV